MTRTRVALATAAELPDLDDEGRLLRETFRARDVEAVAAVWDDPAQDWSSYDVVLVRSTWDYATRLGEFLAWAEQVSGVTRLENSLEHLRWSTDKHYLQALAAAGVPVVESAFLEPGDDPDHAYLDREHVVKPAVSAGSKDTLRLAADEAETSREHARALLDAGRSVLVQPYLPEVDTAGETAVVLLGGVVSHAMRKGPLLRLGAGVVDGLFAEEEMSPRDPSDAELAVAAQTMSALRELVPGPTTYARVDLLPSATGPAVLEVELAEPSLFLEHVERTADRLVDVVLQRLAVGPLS